MICIYIYTHTWYICISIIICIDDTVTIYIYICTCTHIYIYIRLQRLAHASLQTMKSMRQATPSESVGQSDGGCDWSLARSRRDPEQACFGLLRKASNRTLLSLLQFCGIYANNCRYIYMYIYIHRSCIYRSCDSVQLLQPCPFFRVFRVSLFQVERPVGPPCSRPTNCLSILLLQYRVQ